MFNVVTGPALPAPTDVSVVSVPPNYATAASMVNSVTVALSDNVDSGVTAGTTKIPVMSLPPLLPFCPWLLYVCR